MRVDDQVLAVLSAAQVTGPQLVITAQLDRKLYERTNKVLEAAGGKWNRKAKAHVFDGDAGERIDQIILTGDITIPKDEFDFFPTPPALADRIVELADIHRGTTVLEPSAGTGALISALAATGKSPFVTAIEIVPEMARGLRETFGQGLRIGCADFLSIADPDAYVGFGMHSLPMGIYDRIVMNPPFSKQADIKHVTHAFGFLRPGGRLVAVMAAGVEFRQDRRTNEFRELVERQGGVIERLPEGSFKSSGTGVNTVLVVIDR